MRIALLSPLPPERNGIADYAGHFSASLQALGAEVRSPLAGLTLATRQEAEGWADRHDWTDVDVVHAQIGGGRVSEFLALDALTRRRPTKRAPLLTATAHDPERLVWRPIHRGGRLLERRGALPRALSRAHAVLTDPLTLGAERRLAAALDGIVTLTETGASCLAARLRVPRERISVISHGTLPIQIDALPPLEPLRLLYFGFIYRGKGIEDLLDALARVLAVLPGARDQIRLTIAGGTMPDLAFGPSGNYLDELRARVRSLRLEAVVDWQLDVAEDRIASLIQQHHAMVLPYRESRKLALLGQMRGTSGALAWSVACGRGAITSNARSFAEEIASGNGLAYAQGDVAALAACIGQLVRVPTLAEQWADAAARLAVQRAWPLTAERFMACFSNWQRGGA